MKDALRHFRAAISDGRVNLTRPFEALDVADAIDGRENRAFEAEWLRVFNELERLGGEDGLPDDGRQDAEAVREFVFKTVYDATKGNHDLAALASDDFGLFVLSQAYRYSDPWLNGLWVSYTMGNFPHTSVQPSQNPIQL